MTISCRSRGPVKGAWLLGAVFVVLLATLPPQPGTTGGAFLRSLFPPDVRWRDVAQNFALYCPLGLVFGARGAALGTVLGASAGLSLATELLQYAIPGRDPSARDVVVNTLGALFAYSAVRSRRAGPRIVGALVAGERWLVHARDPGPRRASLFVVAWSSAFAIVLAMTAALLQPAPLPFGGLAVASPFMDRSEGPLRIGSSGASTGFFKGTIDEVRIFEGARTPAQIAQDMASRGSASAPPEPGLVAAYKFDSNTGEVARDDSGHGHDGVVSRASWTPDGRFGGALRFDGIASEVTVPAAATLDFDKALTLEAWVLPSGAPSTEATVIARSDDVYYLRATSNQGPFRAAGGGRFGAVPRFALLAEPFRSKDWTHLAMTFDGRLIRLYVNGILSSTRVHWSPHHPERASLNGVEIESGPVPDAPAVRSALMRAVTLETTLVCGALDETPAPALLFAGLQSSEALAVVASGRDLFIKPLARGDRFGLASPATRVRGAMEACTPGSRLSLAIAGRLQNPRVRRGSEALPATAPGLGAGWAFVIHADLLPEWAELMATAVWLAVLAVPLGLWVRWTVMGGASIALVVAALLSTPNLFQVRSLVWHEVAALMIGGTLGMIARAPNRRAMAPPNDFAHDGAA